MKLRSLLPSWTLRTYLRRMVELVVLVLLLHWIALPYQPIVRLGEQQAVSTLNPKIGTHTRLTDEVEEWKIKKTLQMVREMGAPWIVEYFPWAYHEPHKGQYGWEHSDKVLAHAEVQGLTLVARIDFVPAWARPEDTTFRYLDEDHYQDFGDFIYAFSKRYRGRIGYLVVWNEPNLSFEWGYRPPDPESYVKLLQIAYRRAKEANPDIQILAAGLAPTIVDQETGSDMSDLLYLQRMYDAGAKDYFDMMAIHSYGWKWPFDDPPSPDRINFRRAELIHEVMVKNGDGDKRCIITEGGWNDHPRWIFAVSPYDRIQNTIGAYELAKDWDWSEAFCVWAFRYPRSEHTFKDSFTLVTPDFVQKPIYSEILRYAHGQEPLYQKVWAEVAP